ncbi:MAG: HAD family phosphatase [Planctomycetota bacterium]|nr:HAD family phosphatase [Planctomycetota bacterium]
MLDAMIFDFDGVVVDSEPIHLACFRDVLAGCGIELASEDYYEKYLGFDDHDCFQAVMVDNGRRVDERQIAEMTGQKTLLVQKAFAESIRPLPGAIELMRAARSAGAALGICSGALRKEILLAGRTVGAVELVDVVVAAEDVRAGKPDPEGYILALKLLNEKKVRLRSATSPPVRICPSGVWVVEDSPAGVQAGKNAGMSVLAVTNSYSHAALTDADRVVNSLTEITPADL